MEVIKSTMFFTLVITLSLSAILPTVASDSESVFFQKKPMKSKTVSRFLQKQMRSLRSAYECSIESEPCQGKSGTCCKGKCVEISSDSNNCGACGKTCPFGQSCCGGQCVNMLSDVNHCGSCDNKCKKGKCQYGLCAYAGYT